MQVNTLPVPAYEYAILVSIYESDFSDLDKLPILGHVQQTWTFRYELRMPGSADYERFAGDVPFIDILNGLGRQGWRLVDASGLESLVASSGLFGVDGQGVPIRQRLIFMREVVPDEFDAS